MTSEVPLCPYCHHANGEAAICAGCGRATPPLPRLAPPPENQPSALKDGLCCLAAGVGILGMLFAFMFFMLAQGGQNIMEQLLAALVFAGFLTLTVIAWRMSKRFVSQPNEWTPEEFERIVSESPELHAAIASTEPPHEPQTR